MGSLRNQQEIPHQQRLPSCQKGIPQNRGIPFIRPSPKSRRYINRKEKELSLLMILREIPYQPENLCISLWNQKVTRNGETWEGTVEDIEISNGIISGTYTVDPETLDPFSESYWPVYWDTKEKEWTTTYPEEKQ